MNIEHFKKIDLCTRQLVNTLFLGNYKAAFKGRGLEFSDFREYADGDDAKLIDWLVSVKEGKTIIRRYREERELEVLFVLDSGVSMYFGKDKKKIDTLREVFYILGFSAIANGDKLGAFVMGDTPIKRIPFRKGNTSLLKIFQNIPDTPGDSVETQLDLAFLNASSIQKTLLFIVTDKLEIDEKSLKIASLKHDIIFVHISDEFENTLSGKGIHVLGDSDNQISIDLDNTKKKQQYIEARQAKMSQLKKQLLQYKIDSLFITNSDNPYKKILQLMKKREI